MPYMGDDRSCRDVDSYISATTLHHRRLFLAVTLGSVSVVKMDPGLHRSLHHFQRLGKANILDLVLGL
jgi:hypothetical protein